jgi:hypothetical protein
MATTQNQFSNKKSGTASGVGLMRGAQLAAISGARLFAGNPIPALSPFSTVKRSKRDL